MTAGHQPLEVSSPERAAAMVAGITVASRVFGFIRVVVATAVLGVTYLGNAYATANSIPNVIFEIFAGGALAAVVVPALAAPMARGDDDTTQKAASSFANLALLALTPLVIGGILFRRPLMALFTSGVTDPVIRQAERDLGEFLLLLFLPQVWLYAAGILLTGVLHAHRKFGWPAVAPLLSSIVVTISYLVYASVEGDSAQDIIEISRSGRWILGLGTTAGVAALSLSLVLPARRLGLKWRPVLKVPPEAASLARRLLGAAVVAVGGQHLLLAVVLIIANRVEGGVVAYQLAFTILLLPWATLAIPIATASFPGLAAASARNDDEFSARCSSAIRTTVLLVFGGAAVLVAIGDPMSRVILAFGAAGGPRAARVVVPAVLAFAPGLIGYGLYALLTRVAFARGDGRSPTIAAMLAFGSAIAIDLIAGQLFGGANLIAALAVGFSVGMAIAAGFLLVRVRNTAGPAAVERVSGTLARSLVAAIAAAGGGIGLGLILPGGPPGVELVAGLAIAAAGLLIYAAAQRFMGDQEMKRALLALKRS